MDCCQAIFAEEEIKRQIVRLTTCNHELTLQNEQLKLENQTMQKNQRERFIDLHQEYHELNNRNRQLTMQNEQLKRIPLFEQRWKALGQSREQH